MNFEDPRSPGVLMIEAAGLAITGLLLLTIAYVLQLAIRVLTRGALDPTLELLAFGFLFYVCATFLAFGAHQRPAHVASLTATLALHAGFLSLGWCLFRAHVPAAWLARALGFTLLVQGSSFGFARLRQRHLARLLSRPTAIEDTFVERFFLVRPFAHLAIPLGSAAGIVLGSLAGSPASHLAGHAAAGVFALLGARALIALLNGFRMLAGELVTTHEEARVTVRVVSSSSADRFRVFAPEPAAANVEQAIDAAAIAADIRRVQLANQLQHMSTFALSYLVVGALELSQLPFAIALLGLLLTALLLAPLPYHLGQYGTNARVLLPLTEPIRAAAVARLREGAPTLPEPAFWAALLASPALAAAAYVCVAVIARALMP